RSRRRGLWRSPEMRVLINQSVARSSEYFSSNRSSREPAKISVRSRSISAFGTRRGNPSLEFVLSGSFYLLPACSGDFGQACFGGGAHFPASATSRASCGAHAAAAGTSQEPGKFILQCINSLF